MDDLDSRRWQILWRCPSSESRTHTADVRMFAQARRGRVATFGLGGADRDCAVFGCLSGPFGLVRDGQNAEPDSARGGR
ncbi:MAG: hypothetical protein JWP07_2959 [Pseudonocardiales bacterium]|nr:hypothetical protein [Pseudonocardiales bacterium]